MRKTKVKLKKKTKEHPWLKFFAYALAACAPAVIMGCYITNRNSNRNAETLAIISDVNKQVSDLKILVNSKIVQNDIQKTIQNLLKENNLIKDVKPVDAGPIYDTMIDKEK